MRIFSLIFLFTIICQAFADDPIVFKASNGYEAFGLPLSARNGTVSKEATITFDDDMPTKTLSAHNNNNFVKRKIITKVKKATTNQPIIIDSELATTKSIKKKKKMEKKNGNTILKGSHLKNKASATPIDEESLMELQEQQQQELTEKKNSNVGGIKKFAENNQNLLYFGTALAAAAGGIIKGGQWTYKHAQKKFGVFEFKHVQNKLQLTRNEEKLSEGMFSYADWLMLDKLMPEKPTTTFYDVYGLEDVKRCSSLRHRY